ncbi:MULTISPECIES: carboxylate-amine ligase [Streptomyces]|uniref:carboxylate-amine ligase n=1 Tax=Streptomyces TaxID=1883 RepID=UPI002252E01B|nr:MULTISPECIES: glutamate--cysteine ligase [Streptomyces]MCX5275342.1 glutamate--cysteine ligase [Streptomyces virginiae]MCX5582953.1 glutamate--cysteine ligase [Streptomyces erythrochromogenes]
MITLGVEEEFLLLDAATGLPAPLAAKVRTVAGLRPGVRQEEVQAELLQAQLEIATPVCTSLREVGGHLLRMRHALGEAAEAFGCRVAACGAPPLKESAPVPVTESRRYLELREQAPQLVAEQLINGMHIHVGVPDRDRGVAVLNRIRVWLPVLVAMSANSPFWGGRDTGFASWRTVVFGRWPVSGPPPQFGGLADHERRVRSLLAGGVIRDTGQIYWQARLSERYPTVEIRCADVQLDADDAVLFAGLVRALVSTALREAETDAPLPSWPPEMLQAANWYAARHGLGGALLTACGTRLSAREMLDRLMHHISPALVEAGDTQDVTTRLTRFLRLGTPADRQRHAYAHGGIRAVVDLITATVERPDGGKSGVS